MIHSIFHNHPLSMDLTPTAVIKIVAGIFLLISIVTQGKLDPTPISPLWPPDGIQNWFYLPGALVGGFFRDFFGLSAVVLPIFLLGGKPAKELKWIRKMIRCCFNLVLFCLFFSILVPLNAASIIEYSGGTGYIFHTYIFPETNRFMLFFLLLFLIFGYNCDLLSEYKMDMTLPALLSMIVMGMCSFLFGGWRILQQLTSILLNWGRQYFSILTQFLGNKRSAYFTESKRILKKTLKSLFSFHDTRALNSKSKNMLKRKKESPIDLLSQEEKRSKKLFENALKEFEKFNYPGNDTLIDHLDRKGD